MNRILILTVLLAYMLHVDAQRFDFNKFHQEARSYIISQAQLSQSESEAFLKLYDEMSSRKRALHREKRQLRHSKVATDAAIRERILRNDNIDIQMKQIDRDYHKRMFKLLSPRKVQACLKAEERFFRQSFHKMVGRGTHHRK
jgi:hypothetical protein